MADKRISELTTTATTAADDDYIAIDGSTNGTRKILANNVGVDVDATLTVSGAAADSKTVGDELDAIKEDLAQIESGVPTTVRQAIYTLLNKAVYVETGLTDEIAIVEDWANSTVTGITLDHSTLTFTSITTQTLTATVTPADSGATVTWLSSDTSVATVSDGVVTSVGNGSCTITASAGSHSATCAITVSGIATTYTITNNLANCTSTNSQTVVEEGASYTATITANAGYVLDSVTCTMGEVAQTVTGGVINIASVAGDIVISASATLDTKTVYYDWDFTSGLTDSVGGLTATLNGSATQDSDGVHLNSASDYVILDAANSSFSSGRTAEFTIGASSASLGSSHGRLFCFPTYSAEITSGASGYGVIYRSTGVWNTYLGSWGTASSITDADGFANSVIKLVKSGSGSSTTVAVYLNDTLIMTSNGSATLSDYPYVYIGASGQAFHDITITRCRIYEEN